MDEQLAQNQTIDTLWRPATLRRSKPKPFYALIKSNSPGCHRLTIIPVEQQVSLVTLLLCRPCQLLRQDFVPGSYMP